MRHLAVAIAFVGIVPGAVPVLHAQHGHNPRRVIERAVPAYPDLARRMNLRGSVRLELSVLPSGTVKSTKVLGGNPVLAQAAQEAVRRWKYETATEESVEQVELRFDQR